MAKEIEKIRSWVVETVPETFEDALQSSYSDLNEGLKSGMFNIMEKDLTEVVHPGRGIVFDKIQFSSLKKSESIGEQIVKYVLSSMKFIILIADVV